LDKTHEDLILEVTLKKGLLDLCEREFVGKISRTKTFRTRLGNWCKNPSHPKKVPAPTPMLLPVSLQLVYRSRTYLQAAL